MCFGDVFRSRRVFLEQFLNLLWKVYYQFLAPILCSAIGTRNFPWGSQNSVWIFVCVVVCVLMVVFARVCTFVCVVVCVFNRFYFFPNWPSFTMFFRVCKFIVWWCETKKSSDLGYLPVLPPTLLKKQLYAR